MSCFEGAASLVPENEEYAAALEEARLQLRDTTGSTRRAAEDAQVAEAEEKAAPPVRETRRKVSLWLLAGLVLAAVGYATPAFVAEPDWDRSDEFADVAQFDRLHPVPGFGWSGSSAVDTTGWAAAERQQVCSEIMHGLPGDGSLLLSTADGYAVMCQAAPLVQTAEVSP
ncbi:MAG: hypothetical protein GY884_17050 [Proteobacteria bacterium]|nr:hypothetical protein [Pseudomonadota bacterium]